MKAIVSKYNVRMGYWALRNNVHEYKVKVNFIERKLKHDAHNTKHNIKNSSRFLSHEIQKLV
jgi:hypothetical protein